MRGNPQQIEWRRLQVLELSSKGYHQSDIARKLQIDKSIISRDVSHLRTQAKENIKNYINERLPEEYEKCLVGITSIMKEPGILPKERRITERRFRPLSF